MQIQVAHPPRLISQDWRRRGPHSGSSGTHRELLTLLHGITAVSRVDLQLSIDALPQCAREHLDELAIQIFDDIRAVTPMLAPASSGLPNG